METLFIGLMSGTSLDGVDAALVEFSNDTILTLRHSHFITYPAELRAALLALQEPSTNELARSAQLSNQLSTLYAEAVAALLDKAQLTASAIIAIGCHGQTIRHQPQLGYTLQIGNPALLAELTQIAVIADFRSRDIAAGGEGAPLVPAFHQALFAHPTLKRAIVNIGGIANITYLQPDRAVLGFDSGPGNLLLDAWIAEHYQHAFDEDGRYSISGKVQVDMLEAMLQAPYFSRPPPKSTGRELFNSTWLRNYLIPHHTHADVARTLVAFSAHSIAQALERYCHGVDEIYLCGGGAHHPWLGADLQALLGNTPVTTTEPLGLAVDWVEAVAFAWLAKQCWQGKTANLPTVTGARGQRVLGAIYR